MKLAHIGIVGATMLPARLKQTGQALERAKRDLSPDELELLADMKAEDFDGFRPDAGLLAVSTEKR